MVASDHKIKVDLSARPILGRIDEYGRTLLPLCITASDGFELEIEALINLQFTGSLLLPENLIHVVGWRRLGSRRIFMGDQPAMVNQYLGLASLIGGAPKTLIVLGGLREEPVIGQRLLKGRKLSIDFASGQVVLE
jgi:predicted aspartyl protease